MPAYHSQYTNAAQVLGNMALLPLKTQYRGPAPKTSSEDIIDEAINYFKANVFFRTYEVKSEADRTLIYVTLYISECLRRLQKSANKTAGLHDMYSLAVAAFDMPGDPGFPLNAVYSRPTAGAQAEQLRAYLTQLRQETGVRLCERVFGTAGGTESHASKWWLCFARRRFMDKSLTALGQI